VYGYHGLCRVTLGALDAWNTKSQVILWFRYSMMNDLWHHFTMPRVNCSLTFTLSVSLNTTLVLTVIEAWDWQKWPYTMLFFLIKTNHMKRRSWILHR